MLPRVPRARRGRERLAAAQRLCGSGRGARAPHIGGRLGPAYDAANQARFSRAAFENFSGGLSPAVGDVSGDGIADVVVGTATGSSHVKVLDGIMGAELMSFLAFPGFASGVSVGAYDANADGLADVVVGTLAGAPGGHVRGLDGPTLRVLDSFFSTPGFAGGVSVSGPGA